MFYILAKYVCSWENFPRASKSKCWNKQTYVVSEVLPKQNILSFCVGFGKEFDQVVETFLCVVRILSEYKIFEALPKSKIFFHFVWVFGKDFDSEAWRKFSIHRTLRCEYVKHSPRSMKFSAFWIMTVRTTKHFLLKEK